MKLKNAVGKEFNLIELNEPSFIFDSKNYCSLITEQINNGIYNFTKELVTKNSKILDIGGNIGYFSYFIAPLVGSVDTFEPTPETFRVLNKNIILNSIQNVTIHNKAVSNKDGHMSFYVCKSNATMNSLRQTNTVQTEEILVETISLSTILSKFEEKIDFVKLDIEGGEKFIFEDENFFENMKKINNIFVEIHEYDVHLTPLGMSNTDYHIINASKKLEEADFRVERIAFDALVARK